MDNKLVLTVVFVTLSWMFVGSYAQNNTTTVAPDTNSVMTTVMTNMTMAPNMTTAASNNMTHMTTAASNNMTHMTMAPNMTTAASNNMTHMTMAPNMTTAASNNMTHMTMAPNMTTAASNNMTHMTMAPNMTAAAPTVPSLEPNTTVVPLTQNVSNAACGTEQFCASEPSSCNPAVPDSCFFVAAKRQGGRNFEFGLSGQSDGYIAATLSTDNSLGGNDTTYVCANANGVVRFFGAVLDNGQLKQRNLTVNNVKGKVDGRRIQCTFAATLPAQRARAENFAIGIATGSFNSSSNDLGNPSFQFRGSVANIDNPNATVTNELNANTTTPPSTAATTTPSGHANALQQSWTQALLITVGVLSMALL